MVTVVYNPSSVLDVSQNGIIEMFAGMVTNRGTVVCRAATVSLDCVVLSAADEWDDGLMSDRRN